ncbi:restriction endonuclease subunit S [Acidovorax soli]|uniref:Type I restriction enzyme, S subunit n=1 Tax=Acidovorax soli TaxID=592050 RepID=A0A1H4DDA8_9BURK|nr:restriction endonuclease subunit S [Acidovorax soli]SEA70232.1 type I restriction enzyme, S subunit [Acidovorax soli]
MSSEWIDSTLGEFVRLQRGHDLTASEQQPGTVPIMGSAGPNGTHNKALAKGPGLVIGRSGASAGRVHFSEVDYWPHNTCLYVTDFLGNNPRFAYYLLQTLDLAAFNSGSAQPSLNRNFLYSIPLKIPRPVEQDGIVEVLKALDDRITLLRETNATLEAIAQTLFKSWFVDFDPVRAKMEGRTPEGMDEATAALFPDGFETSELGEVPRGWRVGMICDFAQLKKGSVNPGSQPEVTFEHFSLPSFDAGQRPIFELGESIKSNKTPVTQDAVLLSKLNPHIPRIWLPVECGSNAVCSTEFLVFVPTGAGSRELIYCAFSSPDFIARLQQLVTGTSNSHQRIKPDQVALMSSVVPTADVARAFEAVVKPIFQKVFANREQAQTLSTLRDTLLPRLISGQLRLPEAQAASEAALGGTLSV